MRWLLRLVGLDEDSARKRRIEHFRKRMVEADSVGERLYWWRCLVRERGSE